MTQVYTDVLANCPCLPSPTARTAESNFYLNLWFVLLHDSVLAKFIWQDRKLAFYNLLAVMQGCQTQILSGLDR